MNKLVQLLALLLASMFMTVGYAQLTDSLSVSGTADVKAEEFDVYIKSVTPEASGAIEVNSYYSTILSTSVRGASQSTFSITVRNRGTKTYVFERIVEGSETGYDEIYGGDGVSYTLSGLTYLQELAPATEITFTVNIRTTSAVNTDELLTFFKFIEKTGEEVLPGNPDAPTPDPDPDPDTPDPDPDTPTPEPDPDAPGAEVEENFYGLLEALLSESEKCLNDPSDKDVIYEAIQKEMKNEPYILHCLTKSISGGNMANITEAANSKLSENMHFLFMPVKDDPNTLYLFMYRADVAKEENEGTEVLTYFAVIHYDAKSDVWYENGVYVGKAKVAYLDGGGNSGKKAWMIDPSTWTAGAPKSTAK